jgi:hypothetical protein
METTKQTIRKNNGFALLITIIVVGVVLSIGLAVLDLSIKQVELSTNAKQSEIAFHASNAGLECARYWRRVSEIEMRAGDPISPECFGVTVNNVSPRVIITDKKAYQYEYNFTWGSGSDQRCTKINTLVMFVDVDETRVTVDDMQDPPLFPGFPEETKSCEPGGRCTVISVKGYNRPCVNIGNYGTFEREVLLQF